MKKHDCVNVYPICEFEYAVAWGGVMLRRGLTLEVNECEASELVNVIAPGSNAGLIVSAESGCTAATQLSPGMDETMTRHATLSCRLEYLSSP